MGGEFQKLAVLRRKGVGRLEKGPVAAAPRQEEARARGRRGPGIPRQPMEGGAIPISWWHPREPDEESPLPEGSGGSDLENGKKNVGGGGSALKPGDISPPSGRFRPLTIRFRSKIADILPKQGLSSREDIFSELHS